jgi:hypothetical protein
MARYREIAVREPDADRFDHPRGGIGASMTMEGATDAKAFVRLTWSTSWPPRLRRGRWWC